MVDYCFINSQEWSTNQWTKTVGFCYLSFWNADQYISATPKWWIQAVPSSGNGQGELEEQLQNTQGLATFCVKGATYVSSLTAVLKWMPFQNLGIKRLTFRTSSKSASTLTIHWLSAHPILSSSCRELSASGPNTSCNVVASLSHFTYHIYIYMIYIYISLFVDSGACSAAINFCHFGSRSTKYLQISLQIQVVSASLSDLSDLSDSQNVLRRIRLWSGAAGAARAVAFTCNETTEILIFVRPTFWQCIYMAVCQNQ